MEYHKRLAKLRETKKELLSLRNKLATHEAIVNENAALKKRDDQLSQELKTLRQDQTDAFNKRSELVSELNKYKESVDEGNKVMDQMEIEVQRMQKVIDDVEEKNRELQVKLNQVTKTMNHLKSVAKDLTAIL